VAYYCSINEEKTNKTQRFTNMTLEDSHSCVARHVNLIAICSGKIK